MKGALFTFEGIDGSGKGTQILRLKDALLERGYDVLVTKEPTDGPCGSLVHQAMTGRLDLDEASIAALFAADRLDHLYKNEGILEVLEKGTIVLSDRFVLSSLAYNSVDLDPTWIYDLNREALRVANVAAHLYLDLPPDIAFARIESRGVTLERYETLERLAYVRERYLALPDEHPEENICTISAAQPENTIHQAVLDIILPLLPERK